MAPNPSRDSTSGQVFNDLRNLAKRRGQSTQELATTYVHERFLFRLSASRHNETTLLKGGLLLATFGARRSTQDADLLATALDRDEQQVVGRIVEICSIEVDDGVVFATDQVRSKPIRDSEIYAGVRIVMPAFIGKSRSSLAVDMNFGDPVTPGARAIEFRQLLTPGSFALLAYPLETVIAEKVVTMVSRGLQNTRDRDWADVWRLLTENDLPGTVLRQAFERTARHRGEKLGTLSFLVPQLAKLRQAAYTAWLGRQSADSQNYPPEFDTVVRDVVGFTDPILADQVDNNLWHSATRTWRRT